MCVLKNMMNNIENTGRSKEEERIVDVILTAFILVGTIPTNTQQHALTISKS